MRVSEEIVNNAIANLRHWSAPNNFQLRALEDLQECRAALREHLNDLEFHGAGRKWDNLADYQKDQRIEALRKCLE